VWSWVAEPVQRQILTACSRLLSPNGVAYPSYNTYPVWHLRGMVRDMLLYHVRDVADPRQRIARSREFVTFLHENAPDRDSAFARFLGEERQLLAAASDSYLFHEHLEADNRPVWFHQFAALARAHGLRWFAEAAPAELPEPTPDATRDDAIDREQRSDFLRNRMFRRSLLCRADAPVHPGAPAGRLGRLLLGSAFVPERATREPGASSAFIGPHEERLSVDHPWLACLFALLAERWPEFASLAELELEIAGRLGAAPSADETAALRQALVACYQGGALKLHLAPTLAVRASGDRPRASPLAARMARTDRRVANLRHELVELAEPERRLLALLDGTRRPPGLASQLGVDTPAVVASLRGLARAALLLGRGAAVRQLGSSGCSRAS
jgi:hypothetical protein